MSSAAPPQQSLSTAEQGRTARMGALLFRNRGWLPVLFLGIPLLIPGRMSPAHWIWGGVCIVLGEWIRLAGVAAAGTVTRRRSRNVQRLVTYGAFAWVRNPLYVGNFFIWAGFVIVSGVLWFLPVALALFAAEYSLIVRYEEGVLESIFGEAYLAYKRATPRWVPKLLSRSAAAEGSHDWAEALRSERSTFLQYLVLAAAFVIKQRVVG